MMDSRTCLLLVFLLSQQLCVCAADQGSSPTAPSSLSSLSGDDILAAVLAHFRDHGVLTPAQYEHGVANGQHMRENGLHSLRSRDDLKNDGFGITILRIESEFLKFWVPRVKVMHACVIPVGPLSLLYI